VITDHQIIAATGRGLTDGDEGTQSAKQYCDQPISIRQASQSHTIEPQGMRTALYSATK